METDHSSSPVVRPPRLLSLDIFRGFTMFWLIGGREVVLGALGVAHINLSHHAWFPSELHSLAKWQLTHPRWQGFVAWDMVMPMFLFAVGVAMPLALGEHHEHPKPLRTTYLRIVRRVVILWTLGILYQQFHHGPAKLELFSNALQAIAVGYLVTSLATLHLSMVGCFALFVALLLGLRCLADSCSVR